ncbi:MAG: DHHW family protein [Eubacteriales bacterium]
MKRRLAGGRAGGGCIKSACIRPRYDHAAYEIFEQPILRGDYVYFRTDHHWTALGLSCHAVDRETTDIKPFRWRITMSSTIDGFWVRSICTGAARS